MQRRWKDRVEQAELRVARERPLLQILFWAIIVGLAVYFGG